MKKYGIILVALLLLMGCSSDNKDYTPATTTLSGEEVEQKLQKLKIEIGYIEFHEDGHGTISFHLEPKNIDNYLVLDFDYTNWKVSEVMIYEGDYDDDEGFDSYSYYIKDNQNYSYIDYGSDVFCQMAADGKVNKKNNVCKSEYADSTKYLYNELCKKPLKQAGIIREDLITFGNYYLEKHKSGIDIIK